jgi:hypothetical protein
MWRGDAFGARVAEAIHVDSGRRWKWLAKLEKKSRQCRESRALILGGLLGVIDHDELDGGSLRFQLETELFLKRGEDIHAV